MDNIYKIKAHILGPLYLLRNYPRSIAKDLDTNGKCRTIALDT